MIVRDAAIDLSLFDRISGLTGGGASLNIFGSKKKMVEPPIMRRRQDHGTKAEKRAGKRNDAEVHRGSGAVDGYKGDLTKGQFKIESKSTTARSLSVKKEWLDKITREAIAVGKDPALMVQFVDARGRPDRNGVWVMFPEYLWKEMADE